jgi:hypothetical protein
MTLAAVELWLEASSLEGSLAQRLVSNESYPKLHRTEHSNVSLQPVDSGQVEESSSLLSFEAILPMVHMKEPQNSLIAPHWKAFYPFR